jgi:peroxiredoxin
MAHRSRTRAFALCLVSAAALVAAAAPADAGGLALAGRHAPDVSIPPGINGVEDLPAGASLATLRGNVVVLKFWFTACGPCRATMGEFQALHDRFAPRGVRFLAIARDDRGTAESFIRSKGYTFPVAFDPAGTASRAFGVTGYPTHVVIGADGVVRGGPVDAACLERELFAAGEPDAPPAVAKAPAPETARAAPRAASRSRARARTAARAPATPARKAPVSQNVSELGPLPPELASLADAARANDYGEVLRRLEAKTDADSTGELAAARSRVRAIARARFENRVARIRARWRTVDYRGAYAEVRALAHDFRGTELEGWTDAWVRRYEASPVVRALGRGPSPVVARR